MAKTIFVTCTFYIICTSITKQFQQGRRHISKAGSLISNLKISRSPTAKLKAKQSSSSVRLWQFNDREQSNPIRSEHNSMLEDKHTVIGRV